MPRRNRRGAAKKNGPQTTKVVASTTSRGKSSSVTLALPGPTPRSRRRRSRRSGGPVAAFLEAAANPFHLTPPPLGFGSFRHTSALTAYKSFSISLTNAYTSFAALLNPLTIAQGDLVWTGGTDSFLKVSAGVGSDTLGSVSIYQVNLAAANQTFIGNDAYTSRPITGGLRVTVRYATSVAPGRLFVMPVYTTTQVLGASTFDNARDFGVAHEVQLLGAGIGAVEAIWKPESPSDLIFQSVTGTGITNTTLTSKLLILGSGWTGPFSLDVDAIVHYEGDAGALKSAVSESTVGALSAVATLDQVMAGMSSVPDYRTQLAILAEDSAWHTSRALHLTSGRRRTNPQTEHVATNLAAASSSDGMLVDGAYTLLSNLGSAAGLAATVAGAYAARHAGAQVAPLP